MPVRAGGTLSRLQMADGRAAPMRPAALKPSNTGRRRSPAQASGGPAHRTGGPRLAKAPGQARNPAGRAENPRVAARRSGAPHRPSRHIAHADAPAAHDPAYRPTRDPTHRRAARYDCRHAGQPSHRRACRRPSANATGPAGVCARHTAAGRDSARGAGTAGRSASSSRLDSSGCRATRPRPRHANGAAAHRPAGLLRRPPRQCAQFRRGAPPLRAPGAPGQARPAPHRPRAGMPRSANGSTRQAPLPLALIAPGHTRPAPHRPRAAKFRSTNGSIRHRQRPARPACLPAR